MSFARTPGRLAGRGFVSAPRLVTLEDRCVPATLFVDDDLAQIPNAKYQTIQDAVDASAPGDQIVVARGTYTEQVTVPADKDNLTLRSQQTGKAVIEAPATLVDALAIVHIDGATNVTVKGFKVTGPGSTPGGLDIGIAVTDGGSARILENTVTAIRDDPLGGGENGIAILVGGLGGTSASAVVEKNNLSDYQKSGIIVAGSDSFATVRRNTVVGAGPTDVLAQNGIQISDGATAVVEHNLITGHNYTPAGTDAAGIFIVDNDGLVVVSHNRLIGNEDGILVENSSGVRISHNHIAGSALDGIVLNGVDLVDVSHNHVIGSGRDGINLADATRGLFLKNHVTASSRDGIHVGDGSSKNVFIGNHLRSNAVWDAFDGTAGSGTAGTANLWFHNHIGKKSPGGLR